MVKRYNIYRFKSCQVNMKKQISEMYNNYSKILINWKVEPIALVIAMFTYQELWLALKVYIIVTLLIHMPGVFYRAFKKISK